MYRYLQVAIPVPLHRQYDYSLTSDQSVTVGARVRVPFGKRELIGIVTSVDITPDYDVTKIKPVIAVLDQQPILPPALWKLLHFAAGYYHHPLGEVLHHGLPVALRKGQAPSYQTVRCYQVTDTGKTAELAQFKRAPQQQRLMARLQQSSLTSAELQAEEFSLSALRTLQDKGLVAADELPPEPTIWSHEGAGATQHQLNPEQAVAVAAIQQHYQALQQAEEKARVFLLEGVTGSGKTEVYLQAMAPVLAAGKQVLVMVPEIGLTPQTVARFGQRFPVPMVVLHSGLNDSERLHAWLQANDGQAAIIIGTRSAIFTPCKQLGLIVLDEEHDSSFKQQDGFRYHARDLAVKRAHDEQLPLILASATPSFESLANVKHGRYHHLMLNQRAGAAQMARHAMIDLKQQRMQRGLSEQLLATMAKHLQAGNQVLLFLNRRGFASAMICHECGWVSECQRCQTPFTVHQHNSTLQCHHCNAQQRIVPQCQSCGSTQLITQGVGTEQLEAALAEQFPAYPVLRIDRDSTRRKGQLEKALTAAANGEFPILLGTQMLAKGHHFPNVTLVALLDVDGALYSSDFRASERLGQLYIQVAGRAGRAEKSGTVVLQTHHPEHPLIQELVNNGYQHFARTALSERESALLPPYASMALLRAESTSAEQADALLQRMSEQLQGCAEVAVIGPMPAPMARRAGRYRYQLLLHASERQYLHRWLKQRLPVLEALPEARKARWSLDIDPQDFL